MVKYITNFGKLNSKNKAEKPVKKALSVSDDTHAELVNLANSTGQSISFWSDFAIRAFMNSCGPEIVTRYHEYKGKLEIQNEKFLNDTKMKTPPNIFNAHATPKGKNDTAH